MPDGEDHWSTGWSRQVSAFRVEDGLLKVRYDNYASFANQFGHIFFRQPFSRYELLIEYRFVGSQVPDGPAWAQHNSGVMLHARTRPQWHSIRTFQFPSKRNSWVALAITNVVQQATSAPPVPISC